MKKYASLLLLAFLLNGCDDGDITVDSIDFSTVQAQSCTDTFELIYKLKSQESLLLQMPLNTLKNEPTGEGVTPTPIFIDDSNYRLAYRSYNGTVQSTNICSLIPPTSPSVIQQWDAEEGQIEITTTATYATNNTGDGSTRIDGYNHYITIKNVTYPAPGSTVKVTIPEVIIGNFKTVIKEADKLDLVFDESASQCSTTAQVYNFNSSTSLTIDDIDPALLLNESTPANTPRTGLISATKNKLLLRVYNGLLTDGYFCTSPVPTTPTLKETWVGQAGEDKISGIIEVTTTTFTPTTFKHTIVLKNVKLQKGNNVFNLGNSFLLGELIK
jgi:hypothetical protein